MQRPGQGKRPAFFSERKTAMDETALLDKTIRMVLFRLGSMGQKELASFMAYGQNVYDVYKDIVLQNAYLNKYLEHFKDMPPEKQNALLLSVCVLHGMCTKEAEQE